jgi:hypothetical protein
MQVLRICLGKGLSELIGSRRRGMGGRDGEDKRKGEEATHRPGQAADARGSEATHKPGLAADAF